MRTWFLPYSPRWRRLKIVMGLTAVMSFQMTQIKGLVTPFKILPKTSKILRMRKSNLPFKSLGSIS